ncbi:MAG TPA: 1-deoxy-D-xylulose-5-phosphate reductoisomerase [Candidatus Dormibacteraeota bacterium]|nr:1-deoxy-D-xylulose-5-phosphate reductoisomerase [Candidatus Dormibacteraeota bacterium]
MKRVAILGSTGSIGTQALDVIAANPGRFRVVALAAGRRTDRLIEQARAFAPAVISTAEAADAARVRGAAPAARVESGRRGLLACALESGADIVLAATDGAVAMEAVFAAVRGGIDVALANKEVVVSLGEALMTEAAASGARILPVDSEHSAIFQCLLGEDRARLHSIVLTASGGPFWEYGPEELAGVTVAGALRHPTWQMGTKNTIDSATLMNKGLEAIEACRLFALPPERVRVLVHRQSVVHGLAIFTDGSVKAQLAAPDMRLPIGYALAFPERLETSPLPLEPLALLGGGEHPVLTFEEPDPERFPCLALAYRALRAGGTATAVLSAANEVAVRAFVDGEIGFTEIPRLVGAALDAHEAEEATLETVRRADAWARSFAERTARPRHSSTQ